MEIYNSVPEYMKDAKVGDYIVFGWHNKIEDSKEYIEFKCQINKVTKTADLEAPHFKRYCGKTNFTVSELNQQVAVLSKNEFKALRK